MQVDSRLSNMLLSAARCKAVQPTSSERKIHHLQWHEPTVRKLLDSHSCVADCYRILLALLLAEIGEYQELCPGHVAGLIPYLFHSPEQRETENSGTMQRGEIVYIQNTLLTEYSQNIQHLQTGAVGWWVIAFGLGKSLTQTDIKYYRNNTNEPIDDNTQYVLAFINSSVQLVAFETLVEIMFSLGERDLEKSSLSKRKKQAQQKSVTIKVQGHVCSFKPENIDNYVQRLVQTYEDTQLEIRTNLKSLTTAKLDLIRMVTEGTNTIETLLSLKKK